MNYQLLKEDENSFTVKHPNGSQFSVSKKGLGRETLERIQGMGVQKMSDGGVADPIPDPNESTLPSDPNPSDQIAKDASSMPSQNPAQQIYSQTLESQAGKPVFDAKTATQIFPNDPRYQETLEDSSLSLTKNALAQAQAQKAQAEAVEQQKAALAKQRANQFTQLGIEPPKSAQASLSALPSLPSPPGGSVSQMTPVSMTSPQEAGGESPPSDSSGTSGMLGAYGDVYNQESKALKGMTDAQVQQHQDTAQAYQNYLKQQEDVRQQYEQKYNQINQEGDQLRDSIQKGQIDPHRLWSNMSTGNKILAGIGLALSGLGSGLTHQPNAALGVLQKQIEDDIDAQKANLNKQSTLYGMNLQKYKNTEQAEAATRMQLNNVLQAQIANAAAKSGTPQALAQGQYLQGQLKMQTLQQAQQLALMGLKAQQAGAGGQEGGLPVGQEPAAFLSNPDYLKTRVQINDRAYPAASEKEAEEVRNMQANYHPILEGMETLDRIGKDALVPNSTAAKQADVVRRALAQKLTQWNNMSGNAKLSETALNEAKEQLDNPASFRDLLSSGVKNSALKKVLDSEVESRYKASVPGYRGISQYKSFQPISAQAPIAKR